MPIPTDEERLGTLVGGKYLLKQIVGRGGMGVVYEATHTWTSRRVAVKLLNPFFVQDETVVARFLREAQSAASLNHPNVVDVLDMGADDKHTVFIALEFLQGESLAAKLERDGALTPQATIAILMPIMAALDTAHAGGVVHRDLKPENIFLSVDGAGQHVPKLLDFGIAKLVAETTSGKGSHLGAVIGTPHYMSPEQASGSADIGPAADVWSMGVVMYECVTQMLPFEGETPHAVVDAILRHSYIPFSKCRVELPEAFVIAVERAITADPNVRYAQMRQFAIAVAASCGVSHPWSNARPRVPLSSHAPSLAKSSTPLTHLPKIETDATGSMVNRSATRTSSETYAATTPIVARSLQEPVAFSNKVREREKSASRFALWVGIVVFLVCAVIIAVLPSQDSLPPQPEREPTPAHVVPRAPVSEVHVTPLAEPPTPVAPLAREASSRPRDHVQTQAPARVRPPRTVPDAGASAATPPPQNSNHLPGVVRQWE